MTTSFQRQKLFFNKSGSGFKDESQNIPDELFDLFCEMLQRVREDYEGNEFLKVSQKFSYIWCLLMDFLSARKVRRKEMVAFSTGKKGIRGEKARRARKILGGLSLTLDSR